MSAILFGSIGAIAETSELQRSAFNQAFARQGLDWHWSREDYQNLLQTSGGQQRIEDYGRSQGQVVEAAVLHAIKSNIFQQSLRDAHLKPRPGVVEVMQRAKQSGIKLGWVTTTSEQNLAALIEALSPHLSQSDFDLVVNAAQVSQPKPAAEAYIHALGQIDESADQSIAIEDNPDGLAAARSAGLVCVAFPGSNTQRHTFEGAALQTSRLEFKAILGLMPTLAG